MDVKSNPLATLAAAAVLAAALTVPAIAQDSMADTSGAYIFGMGGVHQTQRSTLKLSGSDERLTHKTGPAALAGAGLDLGNDFRVELEAGYRQGGVKNRGGKTRTYSLMGNVFHDLDLGTDFTPYIGGGVGVARASLRGVDQVGGSRVNDHATRPAVQLGAGAAIPVARQLDLTFDYRYLYAGPSRLKYTTDAGGSVRTRFNDHAVFVGLRFALSPPPRPMPVAETPPPPPPPAQPAPPAPAPEPEVREFLVFFDWDRADITPEAAEILRAAAAEAQRVGAVRIVATGHADRSGPAAYNMRLSQRRADAVRSELVGLGIAANEIATIARGETDPLVPTEDGVREPRNRRVQVVLE